MSNREGPGCFGVILNRKDRKFAMPHPLGSLIVEIDMGGFDEIRIERLDVDGKPVILEVISTFPVRRSSTGWLAPR
jgi:hypothetical protein